MNSPSLTLLAIRSFSSRLAPAIIQSKYMNYSTFYPSYLNNLSNSRYLNVHNREKHGLPPEDEFSLIFILIISQCHRSFITIK